MSGKVLAGVIVAAVLALGGWVLAEHAPKEAKAPAPPEGGPFLVSPAGKSAVLLDTRSGKTWVLARSEDGEFVWLAARRLDRPEEVADWQERERKTREERARVKAAQKEAAKEAPRRR